MSLGLLCFTTIEAELCLWRYNATLLADNSSIKSCNRGSAFQAELGIFRKRLDAFRALGWLWGGWLWRNRRRIQSRADGVLNDAANRTADGISNATNKSHSDA